MELITGWVTCLSCQQTSVWDLLSLCSVEWRVGLWWSVRSWSCTRGQTALSVSSDWLSLLQDGTDGTLTMGKYLTHNIPTRMGHWPWVNSSNIPENIFTLITNISLCGENIRNANEKEIEPCDCQLLWLSGFWWNFMRLKSGRALAAGLSYLLFNDSCMTQGYLLRMIVVIIKNSHNEGN